MHTVQYLLSLTWLHPDPIQGNPGQETRDHISYFFSGKLTLPSSFRWEKPGQTPYFLFVLRQIDPSLIISLDLRPCPAYYSAVESARPEDWVADSVTAEGCGGCREGLGW